MLDLPVMIGSKEGERLGRETAAPTVSHGALAAEVEMRLQTSPHLCLRSVTCDQREGVVVLRGRVPSYYHKQLAQELVRQIAGTFAIVNVVEVAVANST